MYRIFAIAIIVCSAASSYAQDQDGHQEAAYPRGVDAIPLLREIWEFSGKNIHPERLGDRFDSKTLKQLEEELRSADNVPLADVLNPFLDSLGVSHTQFYDRRHQTYYMLRSLFATGDLDAPQLYTIGVHLNDKEPGVVRAVMEGSPAAASGVRRGERIVAVDGVPFESLLQWQYDSSIWLTIENQAGRRDVQLHPVRQSFHRALARATVASQRVVNCQDRRIGYLHLWSGTHDVFLDALNDAVSSAKDNNLDGFILDLRDGYGGAWFEYLDPFFSNRDDYFVATAYSRDEPFTLSAEPQNNPDFWDGLLTVIINGGTRSGKESLAYQFKKTGRAKLFGTTTWGAFAGGFAVFVERKVDYFLFLSVRETRLDGTAIEGAGVSPDIVVPDETEHDAPLSAALNHLACNIELR